MYLDLEKQNYTETLQWIITHDVFLKKYLDLSELIWIVSHIFLNNKSQFFYKLTVFSFQKMIILRDRKWWARTWGFHLLWKQCCYQLDQTRGQNYEGIADRLLSYPLLSTEAVPVFRCLSRTFSHNWLSFATQSLKPIHYLIRFHCFDATFRRPNANRINVLFFSCLHFSGGPIGRPSKPLLYCSRFWVNT